MDVEKIQLQDVQETLLLPLWGRFFENQKQKPLLIDPKADEIITHMDYDFAKFIKSVNPLSRAAWIARSIHFDEKIKEHCSRYPYATIINIGCGLDTTFDRVNNGKATWYEMDFPDVIAIRKKFLTEEKNRVFIGGSALADEWYKKIAVRKNVFIFMGGVLYYFNEAEVKGLLIKIGKTFGKADVAFDYCSKKGVEITNKKVLKKSGVSDQVRAQWGIDDLHEIETWSSGIKIIENMNLFKQHKRKFPVWKRLGMNISDRMKIMSLAKIEIMSA